jgi:phosphoesterase RecJ-like protein
LVTGKNQTLEQASQLIRSSCYPVLLCHVDPDGDAIGSLTGLGRALHHLGKQPVLACADPVPSDLGFVPGSELVVQRVYGPCDLVISLDCSEWSRVGHVPHISSAADIPLINIDHHVTNLGFGTVNLVDALASSTAEIVFRLLEAMTIPLDEDIAMCLLTGIVTDTRGFRTNNVTIETMEAALRLMRAGASLRVITQRVLDRRSVSAMRLWGAALATAQIDERVIWAVIPMDDLSPATGNAGLASFLISAEGTDAAAVFVEREHGRVEVGLRAAPGFDVAQVALWFGGGGHALAAGCALQGSLEEVQEQVLAVLQANLARQRLTYAGRDSQPQ